MAESRRYLLTIQGLPLFNRATPLNIVIPPMAGPQITVEVNIPTEYLTQTEFSAPPVVSPVLATSSPLSPFPGQQMTLSKASASQLPVLGGSSNPPISSPLASPGQPLNIPSTQLASSPRSSSPARENSLTLPLILSSSAQRASVPGSSANVEPQMASSASPRFRPAPLSVSGQSMIMPASVGMVGLSEKKPSPGEAFRLNPTLSAPKTASYASLAEVLKSPQMLQPASVQAWTAEPPLSKMSCPSMPSVQSIQESENEESQSEVEAADEEMVEQASQRGSQLPAPMPSYRCPVAQAVPVTAPMTPSMLLSRPSGY